MTSPATTIPISDDQQTAPISTPAFRLFLSRLSHSLRRSLVNSRPWYELADRSNFARPESLSEAISRVRKNISYFRINYTIFLVAVLAFSLFSHPVSLIFLLSLLGAWCFLYLFRPADPPLVFLGRQFSDREILGGLIGLTVFVVFLTSIGSLIISALTVGAALVSVHGAFRVPEDLFLDDQETGVGGSGLLSFLGGAASSAGPAMAARV